MAARHLKLLAFFVLFFLLIYAILRTLSAYHVTILDHHPTRGRKQGARWDIRHELYVITGVMTQLSVTRSSSDASGGTVSPGAGGNDVGKTRHDGPVYTPSHWPGWRLDGHRAMDTAESEATDDPTSDDITTTSRLPIDYDNLDTPSTQTSEILGSRSLEQYADLNTKDDDWFSERALDMSSSHRAWDAEVNNALTGEASFRVVTETQRTMAADTHPKTVWAPSNSEGGPASPHTQRALAGSQELLHLFHKSLREEHGHVQATDPAPRYLVYLCQEDGQHCGGWADRQRGMLSVFLLARVIRRKFKVDMRIPCNLTNFLQPAGEEDWWGREEEGAESDSFTVINDIRRSVLARQLLNGTDLNVRYPQRVLYVETTRDLAPAMQHSPRYAPLLPAWARHASQAARFRLGWSLLASPSPSITRRLHAIFSQLNITAVNSQHQGQHVNLPQSGHIPRTVTQTRTVDVTQTRTVDVTQTRTVDVSSKLSEDSHDTRTSAVQMRTNSRGSAEGNDSDSGQLTPPGHSLVCAHLRMGRNPSMPDDTNIRNHPDAVQATFTFLQQFMKGNNSYVFIATDDQGVRVAARRVFGRRLVDHGGPIVHIDRQGEIIHACAGFETAILDQFVLSQCDVLVMSRSGFSRHAAYLRHRQDGLFFLHHGVITPYTLQ
ncbi:uncharacterized protein [Littorina saxatilis]|uniref:uncharacterized protein n=1 Tax=Littorina saxatilis TaxID=31220 RepID=UPI0038B453E9